LLFLKESILNKNFQYFKNIFFIIFIIWCLYNLVRSYFSEFVILSLESSLFYFRFGFFTLAIWYVCDNIPKIKIYFYYLILFVFIIIFIDSLYQYFSGYNILGFEYKDNRVTSFFGTEMILGSYIIKILLIFIILSICEFVNKLKVYFSTAVLIMSFIIIALSGERVALFNFYIMFFLLILIINRKITYLFFGLLLIISLSFILLTPNLNERFIKHTFSANQINLHGSDIRIFSNVHQQIYTSSIKIFKDNPIFGTGTKTFREICSKPKYASRNSCSTHPHNIYIQLLAETGIIGFLPIFSLYLFSAYILIKKLYYNFTNNSLNNVSKIYLVILVPIIINLFPFMPTGNLFNNHFSAMLFFPLGFCLHYYYSKNNK
jgi:O-antigen ligase